MSFVPIVLECPECGEQYLISENESGPSDSAVVYSDGYYIDDVNWRTPGIIGCVTCELGFEPGEGKIVDKPDWDTFIEKWSQLKKAEPPTAGALALELRVRKKMDRNFEIALRTEFWYAAIHTETGRLLMSKNKKFKEYWIDSLHKLEALLSEESEIVLKAEINRQLGNFDTCIKLLENQKDLVSIQIIEKAKEQNVEVFVLNK